MTDEQSVLNEERRRHERLGKKFTVSYRLLENMANEEMNKLAELCDFSGGGARFLASEPQEKNEQLVLAFEFPGWQTDGDDWARSGEDDDVGHLQVIGTVMWCCDRSGSEPFYEIGVRFTGRIH